MIKVRVERNFMHPDAWNVWVMDYDSISKDALCAQPVEFIFKKWKTATDCLNQLFNLKVLMV